MMVLRLSTLLVALAGLTVPAQAAVDDPNTEVVVEGTKSGTPEDKVICKGERSLEFGSHRRARQVCKTESDWKLLERGTQRELQAFKERAQTRGDANGR